MHDFNDYLRQRFSSTEIAEIEQEAEAEFIAIQKMYAIQTKIADKLNDYMVHEKIGLRELAQRAGFSLAQLDRIRKAKANLTLASLTRLFALIGAELQVIIY